MISHPSAGVQPWGHPLRTVSSGAVRVDASQNLGSADPHSDKLPVPLSHPQARQPAVIDLTTSGWETQDREPPAKRLKLDTPTGSSMGNGNPAVSTSGELNNASGTVGLKPSSLSWRNRPVWSFQALISETYGGEPRGENAADATQERETATPPPFPNLPWKYAPPEPLGNNCARSRECSPVKDVQTTPYRIEVPSIAPVLKGDRVADFSPWTGNHPEDVLNEQTAKQGHYDRTQVSQNESNTARPSLYAQLKHRSGLQMLSSVFAAALEKRQNRSTVTAPSTFKPPPRVTLTDNKREAWLRDLANPSVPLRRLSRTIPHGIRGKVLLDQCLNKWIPAGRAVWLAKCVGANEIRAFKRKGTSGTVALGLEVKWVRDWTTNVQQFIEGVVSACGKVDWKTKVTYAVNLAARLFSEHLLDHDHYLDWFLSSLEAAPINLLPVWLLMLGVYWDNVLRYRKRGRRLAELLLEKRRQVTQSKQVEFLQPLIDRLSNYIKRLIQENTSSVVIPSSWDTYKDTVASCLNLGNKVDKAVFQNLAERNSRVQLPKNCRRATVRSQQQRVIQLCDSVRSTHHINSICAVCLDTIEDRAALVSTLFEWTASLFRHGLFRVFTCVRLLRKWKISGIDIDSHILTFLSQARDSNKLDMGNIYHVISELVRSQTFSVGRYLQWLMARGVTDGVEHDKRNAIKGYVGLLAHLPTNRLPEHVRNLRNTLMTRFGLSASEEVLMVQAAKASISHRLPNIFGSNPGDAVYQDLSKLNLTWAVKSEIGQWIRRGVAEYYRDGKRIITGMTFSTADVSALTPDEFYGVRDILEGFEDLSMLADVLKTASDSDDAIVLAAATDTLNYHFDSFCAIGATTDLFRRFVEAYARLKSVGIASLDLVFSLIELGLRMPSEFNTVALLRQELSRMENRSAMAASSPVSDHMPDAFNETDPFFYEKLDQLLSSGNGMDEATLDMIFNMLTKHLLSGGNQGKLSANNTCRYLAQLRSFLPKHFDLLLVRWICAVLKSPSRPTLSKILAPLIGVGCVTLQAFVSLLKSVAQQSEAVAPIIPNMTELQTDLLELLVPVEPGQGRRSDLVSYRFYLAQQDYLLKHSEEILCIIRDTAASVNQQGLASATESRRMDFENCVVTLLGHLLIRNPECATQSCVQKLIDQNPASMAALQKALNLLLGLESQTDQKSVLLEAQKVINMTNDFSLPFCQLKLQILFNVESGEEVRKSIVDAMFKAAVADARVRSSHWVDLVALMSQDAVRQIRERAEKGFLSVPLFESPADDPSSTTTDDLNSLETARVYLTIIEALAYSIPETGVPSITPALVEKMDLLLHKLVVQQANYNNFAQDRNCSVSDQVARSRSNFERALAFWFSALLRMIVLHRSAFNTPPSLTNKPNTLPEQTRLLVAIFCIALSRLPSNLLRLFPVADYFPHPAQSKEFHPCPGILLHTHALDVAASLIDTFPDEARLQCARFLKEKCPPFANFQNDPRFVYLLGPVADFSPVNAPQPVPVSSPAASGGTPTTTPSVNPPVGSSGASQPVGSFNGLITGLSESQNCMAARLHIQYRGRIIGPYPIRPWELLEDAAPLVGVNDTAVGLGYFDARRVRA